MAENSLFIDPKKQIGFILSVGAVSLTILPYNKELCDKIGITKGQFKYLKLHFKHNPKQALNDLLTACKLQEEGI